MQANNQPIPSSPLAPPSQMPFTQQFAGAEDSEMDNADDINYKRKREDFAFKLEDNINDLILLLKEKTSFEMPQKASDDYMFDKLVPTIKLAAEATTKRTFKLKNLILKKGQTEIRILEQDFPTNLINTFKNQPEDLRVEFITAIMHKQIAELDAKILELNTKLSQPEASDILLILKTQISSIFGSNQDIMNRQCSILDKLQQRIKDYYIDHQMYLSLQYTERMKQHAEKTVKSKSLRPAKPKEKASTANTSNGNKKNKGKKANGRPRRSKTKSQ
jgi:hypothetical protein